jgi:hypothetical protein
MQVILEMADYEALQARVSGISKLDDQRCNLLNKQRDIIAKQQEALSKQRAMIEALTAIK